MQISHSAVDEFRTCPWKYKLNRIDKIRPITVGSPLIFGKAIDNALNGLLLTKKKVLTPEEKLLMVISPVDSFNSEFTCGEINGEKHVLFDTDLVDYFNKDFDPDLLTATDFELLASAHPDFHVVKENVAAFKKQCESWRKDGTLDGEFLTLYNYCCWLSLRRKGHLLIEAYETQILPKIDEVLEIQKEVKLGDEQKNFIKGYIDVICRLVGEDFPRIMDNKTSSALYEEDRARTSQQLSIYSEFCGIPHVGYFVMDKNIRKRPPYVKTQILTDTITEETKEKIFSEISEISIKIENKEFVPNLADNCFAYGRPCVYYNYCRKNDMKGLVDLNAKKDNDSQKRS